MKVDMKIDMKNTMKAVPTKEQMADPTFWYRRFSTYKTSMLVALMGSYVNSWDRHDELFRPTLMIRYNAVEEVLIDRNYYMDGDGDMDGDDDDER